MSIIYDALKKVESAPPAGVNLKVNPPKARKLYLIYLLVVCLGLFAGNIIFGLLGSGKAGQSREERKPALIPVTPTAQSEPNVPVLPTPVSAVKEIPQPVLELNGIFFSEDEGYALINNQIVKTDDIIEGLIVKRIDAVEVELEKADGSLVRLTTNR